MKKNTEREGKRTREVQQEVKGIEVHGRGGKRHSEGGDNQEVNRKKERTEDDKGSALRMKEEQVVGRQGVRRGGK